MRIVATCLLYCSAVLISFASEVRFKMFTPVCVGDEDTCGWAAGGSMNIGAQIMVDHINRHRYLMDNSTLVVDVIDDHCTPKIARKSALQVLLSERDSWPFGVIGSGCSGATMQIQPLFNAASIPLISHSATSTSLSNRAEYPDFFRIFPHDGLSIKVWFHIFYTTGWKKFALGWDNAYGYSLENFARSVAASYNGQMVDEIAALPSQFKQLDLTPKKSRDLLEAILDTRVRAVMIMGYEQALSVFACQMVKYNVRGMYLAHLGWYDAGWWQRQGGIVDCSVQEMDEITDLWFSGNPPAWGNPTDGITCIPGGITVREFAEEYEMRRALQGEEYRAEAGAAADAVCMMATLYNDMRASGYDRASLFAMSNTTYAAWSAKAQSVSFSGSSGSVTFQSDGEADGAGDRIGPCEVFQKIANQVQTLGLASDGPAGMTMTLFEGKQFVFHGNFTAQNPPSELFSSCPDRTVYDFQSMECVKCDETRVFVDKSAACECKAGFFEDGDGTCQSCVAGTFSSLPSSKSCSDCSPGRFASQTGNSECLYCEVGFIASAAGATACDICPIEGSETAFRGAASITDCICPAGFFLHESTRTCFPYLTLGMLLPFTLKPHYLPVLSLFELDVQANINGSGHSGLAAPIVPIQNISEFVQLQVYARNTGGMSDLSMRGMIELSGGQDPYTRVHGVVGAYYSTVSIPTASLGKMLETIQISHASPSTELSDKESYPFFLRTVPSTYYLGKAFWAYFLHFGFSTFALVYESSAYGIEFYEVFQDEKRMHPDISGRVSGHRLPAINADTEYADVRKGISGATQIGGRLLALVVHSPSIPTVRKALNDGAVWAPEYQFLWSDVGGESNQYFPHGSHSFFMEYHSAQPSFFRDAFSRLTIEHYAGSAARSRWRVDAWESVGGAFNSSLIREAWLQQQSKPDPYVHFLFDACYCYVHAYNLLLRRGVDPRNVHTRSMLEVLKDIEFYGVTGKVSFNRNGDRIMNYSLLNLQSPAENANWVSIGSYDSSADTLAALNVSLWMDNSRSLAAPEQLRGCQNGFAEDASAGCSRISDPTDCAPGQGIVDASGTFLESASRAVKCEFCDAGFTSQIVNEDGQDTYVCSVCEAGRFQQNLGSSSPCEECTAGAYTGSTGQSQCQRCPRGTYANSTGASGCFTCYGQTFETNPSNNIHANALSTGYEGATSYSDCRCDEGTYRSRDDPTLCERCPESSDCGEGSQQETNDDVFAPKVKDGFMGYTIDGDLKIFKCSRKNVCPGNRRLFKEDGSPTEDTICEELSTGIACATCEDNAYLLDGKCTSCEGLPTSPGTIFLCSFAVALSGCCVFYYDSMFPPNPISFAIGIFTGLIQSVAVTSSYAVSLGGIIEQVLISPAQLINLDFALIGLPPDCGTTLGFAAQYALRLTFIAQLWICFLIFFWILRTWHRLMVTIRPDKKNAEDWIPKWRIIELYDYRCRKTTSGIPFATRVGWFFDAKLSNMINATVKTTGGLFITIVKACCSVFRSFEHPSGIETLQEYPSVIVESDGWWDALLLSCIGLSVFCIGFLAFYIHLVIRAPRSVPADPVFRQRYRGLWAKFDPSSWWFGLVHLAYGLGLNVMPACTDNARAQLIATNLTNSIYIIVVCQVRPWKWSLNHRADVVLKISYACFILFTMGGALGEEIPETATSVLMLSATFIGSGYVLVTLVRYAWKVKIDEVEGFAERANFAQRFLDLSNIVAGMHVAQLRRMTMEMLDRDVHLLDRALDVLQYTSIGLQPNSVFGWRAGLKPFEVCRPGRLEGELIARKLQPESDCRFELRLLQQGLQFRLCGDAPAAAETDVSIQNSLSTLHSHLVHTEFEKKLRQLFSAGDDTGDMQLDKDEFCQLIEKTMDGWRGPQGEMLRSEALGEIFDFIDVNQGGTLCPTEFLFAMRTLPNPIYPRSYQPSNEDNKAESDKEFLDTEMVPVDRQDLAFNGEVINEIADAGPTKAELQREIDELRAQLAASPPTEAVKEAFSTEAAVTWKEALVDDLFRPSSEGPEAPEVPKAIHHGPASFGVEAKNQKEIGYV